MLYKSGVIDEKEPDFLFEAEIFNEDIDFREVAAIQGFYGKHGYIPDDHIVTLLNWMTYSARKNTASPIEDITKASFAGRCSRCQSFFCQLLEKMNFKYLPFNVGGMLGTAPIHALTYVEIPTKLNGQNMTKSFVLDPTFRQFCLTEENRFERYNEEPRWGIRMSTPHPGYFFNLTDEGRMFAKELIYSGFFEVNEDSLKTYFDPFVLYATPKESYDDPSLVGHVASTTANGKYYFQRMYDARVNPLVSSTDEFDLSTPREIMKREDNRLINRIRGRNTQSELDAMFEEQQIVSSKKNVTK